MDGFYGTHERFAQPAFEGCNCTGLHAENPAAGFERIVTGGIGRQSYSFAGGCPTARPAELATA